MQNNISKFQNQTPLHPNNIASLDYFETLTRETRASALGNSQLRTSGDVSFVRSTDSLFIVNSIKSFQNGAWFYSNTFGKTSQKLPARMNFVLVFDPFKKSKCLSQFLPRYFTTTTAVNTCTNDDKSPELSFQEPDGGLTHVNRKGKANMVDVGDKKDTVRYSVAKAKVKLNATAFELVKENKMKKGDVLNVAKLAGIMAAKQTGILIPLCHNIPLSSIKVNMELEEATHSVVIEGKVKCFGKTGVEMEALTCVSVAALTVYDMCKAVTKDIIITDVQLMEKDGGKSGYFSRRN